MCVVMITPVSVDSTRQRGRRREGLLFNLHHEGIIRIEEVHGVSFQKQLSTVATAVFSVVAISLSTCENTALVRVIRIWAQ